MNNGNFQNVGGPRPGGSVNQQPGRMQRNGGTSSDIRPHILNILQTQQVPPGWQQTIQPQQRVMVIHQMVTGLQIVKPDMSLQYAISVATTFEMGEFQGSPDQATYDAAWRQKLRDITRTRQNQANMQQQQFQNPQAAQFGLTAQQQMQAQAMMNTQNQFRQGFGVPQAPQVGQPLGVPMQQQLSQNQRPMQNGNPIEMVQPMHNGQHMPNMVRPGPPNRVSPQFTLEENQQILGIARQMATTMTEQEKENIQRRLAQLPISQQQAMQANNVQPLQAYIRNQATQLFLQEKNRRQQQLGGQSIVPQGNGAMPPQARPASQIAMRAQQQPHPNANPQQADPAFTPGNMDQFLGQQQDALRHQAAGQDVVPASNGQGAPPQMRGTPHPQPQGQFAPNRIMQPPNSFQPQAQPQPQWNGQQNQQPNVSQTPQMPNQPATPNFMNMQGQTPQQQALQGQLGGLNNNRGQRTPQQNHNMPTLNQPMDPPNQAKTDPPQRPPQPTPKQGQRNVQTGQPTAAGTVQPNPGQQGPQAGGPYPPAWAKLPPQIQERLQRLPEHGRKQLIMQMRKQQQDKAAEAQRTKNAENSAQTGSQGAAAGKQFGQGNNTQATATPNPAGPQQGASSFGRVNMQPTGNHQQGPPNANRPLQKMLPAQLNETQIGFMDRANFPPTILNRNTSLGQIPDTVRSWGQLKDFVKRSAQNLPNGSLQNIINLQSLHAQQIRQAAQAQHTQNGGPVPQGNAPSGQTGAAPEATMIPPQQNQPPVQSNVASGPFGMHPLPQPTMQQVHAARAILPEHMKGISDDQLRGMIMNRRQQELLKASQQRLTPQQRSNLLQAQRAGLPQSSVPVGPKQPPQLQQLPRGQLQPPQPAQQHVPQPTPKQMAQPVGPRARQAPPNPAGTQGNATQTVQKGPKRNTNDDVVEVPDPKKAQQQIRPPSVKVGQPPSTNVPRQMTQEQFALLSNEQKAQVQARMQENQAAQRARMLQNGQNPQLQLPAAPSNQNPGQNPAWQGRLKQLIDEVNQTTPPRPVIPMSPKTRSQMIEKLKDRTSQMVQRIEQSLPIFLGLVKNEDQTRELLRIRMNLLQQVQDSQFDKPVDNFTMTLQDLDDSKNKLHAYFAFMLAKFQPQTTGGATAHPPLNAANLQQQQAAFSAARVASAQKNHANNHSNRAPAAPTTTHAPINPFGSQSPQGVPQIYAPSKNMLTQDKLVLPTAKKRKGNQGASVPSTPAQAQNTPVAKSSPLAKVESPEAQRAVQSMVKCPVPDCESSPMLYTKEEMAKHRTESHEPKEPVIKDPLEAAAYAIKSLRIALNLDESGKPKATQETNTDKKVLQASAMKTSASSQGQNTIKQEAATPMSRNPTQTGPSPSSNLLKTPQNSANVKTPASEAKSTGKDAANTVRKLSVPVKSPAATVPDAWVNSHVKPEWFKEVFSDVANLNRAVPDVIIADFLASNPFTPPTSPSSGKPDKDSPHKSDISANDMLNINVVAEGEDEWLPAEWFDDGLRGEMEALDMGGLLDMDWETAFGKPGDDDEVLGKGKRRRDPLDPSDEWLKVWAPEKYEETKKEAQRKR